MPASRRTWLAPPALLLVALPWLNPSAVGPSPAVVPWLVSAACGVLLWLLATADPARAQVPRALPWAGVALLAWAVLTHPPLRPELAMLAGALALVVLACGAARAPALAPALQGGLLAAAGLSAGLGLAQYFGWAAALAPWVSQAGAGEAFGNLRQPNQFATLCWIGLAVLAFGTLRLAGGARLALAVLLAAGCAASASRTGIVELLVLVALAAAWLAAGRRERLRVCVAAALAYAVAAFLLPVLLEAFTGSLPERRLAARFGGGEACVGRDVLWANVLRLIEDRPLAGWGWGELDYVHYATLYDELRFCEILDNAHNLPLHLAVELGVPLALAFCAGALWLAWRQRPWQETDPLRQLAWALLALLAVHSLLEYPLWYGPFQLVLGLALGWLARTDPADAAVSRLRLQRATAGLLLAATGYAAWDYARVSQVYLPPEQRAAPWREDALAQARRSWLFSGPARFAEVTLAQPTAANAAWLYREASRTLHYSPEPAVIERVIESATALERRDEAVLQLARYRAAFPEAYAAWRQRLP